MWERAAGFVVLCCGLADQRLRIFFLLSFLPFSPFEEGVMRGCFLFWKASAYIGTRWGGGNEVKSRVRTTYLYWV